MIFMFIISCSEDSSIISPKSENYFQSDLVDYGKFIQSSIPAFGLNENTITAQQKRAHIYWYNKTPSFYHVNDILADDVKVSVQESLVTVLDVVFSPAQKGIYNNGEISQDLKSNWGGFFCVLPDSVSNKFQNNNLVLKIWIRIENTSPDAELYFDLGKISEEIIPNGRLDSEDKNMNDLLDDGEDTGIDGIFNLMEPAYNSENDPNGDDFYFQYNEYKNINGLENNKSLLERKRLYDTEDINKNYILDTYNDYFSYKIPLDKNKLVADRIIEYGKNGWMQLKIPVDLPSYRVGAPDKNIMESMRLWITNAENKVHIQIAEIKFEEI
jgi:hypothetical protein